MMSPYGWNGLDSILEPVSQRIHSRSKQTVTFPRFFFYTHLSFSLFTPISSVPSTFCSSFVFDSNSCLVVAQLRPSQNQTLMDVAKIAQILSETLSNDAQVVHGATESLDRLSSHPELPFALLYIASGKCFFKFFYFLLLLNYLSLFVRSYFNEVSRAQS